MSGCKRKSVTIGVSIIEDDAPAREILAGWIKRSHDFHYVSSYGTDQVLRYDGRTGAFLGAFVPARYAGLSAPYALLFGPDALISGAAD